jgi:dihydrodipicolinate synthase/N-acetylneuraminate lyase
MYRNIIGIKESLMDLIQRTELVNANTIGDKDLIQIRGRRKM